MWHFKDEKYPINSEVFSIICSLLILLYLDQCFIFQGMYFTNLFFNHIRKTLHQLTVETDEYFDCLEQNPSATSRGWCFQIQKAFIYEKEKRKKSLFVEDQC